MPADVLPVPREEDAVVAPALPGSSFQPRRVCTFADDDESSVRQLAAERGKPANQRDEILDRIEPTHGSDDGQLLTRGLRQRAPPHAPWQKSAGPDRCHCE